MGEELNYNNVLNTGEDRDPIDGQLNQNWSTRGGCGWQTKSGNATGGVWHTGTIYDPDASGAVACMVDGATLGQCQRAEPFPATAGSGRFWWENLQTPVVSKVNLDQDAEGRYIYRTQFTNWAWNMEIDLPDVWTRISWELDTDVDALRPINLSGDTTRYNSVLGRWGAIQGSRPFTDPRSSPTTTTPSPEWHARRQSRGQELLPLRAGWKCRPGPSVHLRAPGRR